MKERAEKKAAVLVVDDDPSIRRFLRLSLDAYGYGVLEAENARQAVSAAAEDRPDIMILDLGLPDKNGIEVVREVRRFSSMPIVILSVRDEDTDKIPALDAGADDYVTKPFHVGELLARLRAVRRRAPGEPEPVRFRCGDLSLDFRKRLLLVKGKPVHLTPTEYGLLHLLARNAGKVVTRGRILKDIWDKDPQFEGVDHLLRVTVSNLRNKIEPVPEHPAYILTEPGVGYRLRSDD